MREGGTKTSPRLLRLPGERRNNPWAPLAAHISPGPETPQVLVSATDLHPCWNGFTLKDVTVLFQKERVSFFLGFFLLNKFPCHLFVFSNCSSFKAPCLCSFCFCIGYFWKLGNQEEGGNLGELTAVEKKALSLGVLFLPCPFFSWPLCPAPVGLLIPGQAVADPLCAQAAAPSHAVLLCKLCLLLPPCSGCCFSAAFLGQPAGQKVGRWSSRVLGVVKHWRHLGSYVPWGKVYAERNVFPLLFPQGSSPIKVVGFFLKCQWVFYIRSVTCWLPKFLRKNPNSLKDWGIATETWPGRETRSSPFGSGAWGRQWWGPPPPPNAWTLWTGTINSPQKWMEKFSVKEQPRTLSV